MPKMQPKIVQFFGKANHSLHRSRRNKPEDKPKYLSSEKTKLKARLKLVGEETRRAYVDCEQHDPRVGAAYTSTYLTHRCAPAQPMAAGESQKTQISVVDSDSLDAVIALRAAGAQGQIGVLNMASDKFVGGGFLNGAAAQEESICRRSTLYKCLISVKDQYYPIPRYGVLVSPDVFIFRTGIDTNFRILPWEECFFVTILSAAALRNPPVHNNRFERPKDRLATKIKITELLRAAHHSGCVHVVLGALGCGAFNNPPQEVAEIFRTVLAEPEFAYAFQSIVFAIIDSRKATYGKKTNNLEVFRKELQPDSIPSAGGDIQMIDVPT